MNDKADWESISTTLPIKYTWAENKKGYFTFSEGFQAGSYQKVPVSVADVSPISPETLDNYELGFKGKFFEKRLSLEISSYFIQLSDMQLQGALTRNGLTASIITNAASAQSSGFELLSSAVLSPRLKMTMSYGYNATEFNNYQINESIGRSGGGRTYCRCT